ncbi:hypothetical protein FPD60_03000 [Salmonella enterica subsp. enterica]|nr:hypothetical protein [Salmonella enterica subsp. enterica serovar Potsdam]EBR0461112.1 hypothetical protein [Salmonella enterica subsp. enterica serovar Abony]EBZ4058569.1 hypothetical protein [Salmonella enterica subsp. enterica serovar Newport]EDA5930014.1 hypothetical protein [Salmonella enterica subsp. enterica serovar Kottbus]EDV4904231.1 hypothetical protein [Salmonella enterica subsp. enterica]EEB1923347.1 hypothetical protein [Salmonella enterica subsp. enterica serovar Hvittingfoss
MSVKFIVNVKASDNGDFGFDFEIDDSKQNDAQEYKVVEYIAGACLVALQRISSNGDIAATDDDITVN